MCFSTVITQFFRSSSTCGSDETGDILLFSNVNFFTFKKKKKRSFDNDELIITYRDKNFEQDSIQGYFHYSKVED